MKRSSVLVVGLVALLALVGSTAVPPVAAAPAGSAKVCWKVVKKHGKVVRKHGKVAKKRVACPKSPDFTLTANPSTLTIQAGGASGSTKISVVAKNGFGKSVAFTTSTVNGVTFSLTPAGSGATMLLATAGLTASPGSATVTVTGSGGGKTHTVKIALTITAPPPGSTRGNPFPLRATASVPDWNVRVNSVTFNAWSIIQAVNEFNEPPAAGWEDVLINVTMTYTGTSSGAASGTPWLDFAQMEYVGASNVAYTDYDLSHDCGVPPDPDIDNYNTVLPGGSVTANACFQIQTSDESSLVGFWDEAGTLGPWFALR